jgi:hypothetical protein
MDGADNHLIPSPPYFAARITDSFQVLIVSQSEPKMPEYFAARITDSFQVLIVSQSEPKMPEALSNAGFRQSCLR